MEEHPATTTPAAPVQQDGAAALLIDTTKKEDWSEEMEVATQPEEYVERRVRIREEVPPNPTTRKFLIPDTPNVSIKNRLGMRGGQRYPPGPRQGQDYQNRYQQSQGQYGPGGAPAYRGRARQDYTPYLCLEARKKSSLYSTYSDLPPNLAQQTAQNTSYNSYNSYNRTPPPPRPLGARPKNSPYPYNSSNSTPSNPEQARLYLKKKPFIPKNKI